jgi:hypothetical protein
MAQQRHEQIELLFEQFLVLGEIVAEQRKGLGERAAPEVTSARPFEAALSVENRSKTRIGSSD